MWSWYGANHPRRDLASLPNPAGTPLHSSLFEMHFCSVLQVLAEAVLFGAVAAHRCDVEFGLSGARSESDRCLEALSQLQLPWQEEWGCRNGRRSGEQGLCVVGSVSCPTWRLSLGFEKNPSDFILPDFSSYWSVGV